MIFLPPLGELLRGQQSYISIQPIFLLPLSITVCGEMDEQIKSPEALKKETFTRIFIMLIPPSFPTKCFLYCSSFFSSVSFSLSLRTLVMVASQFDCFGFRNTRFRFSLGAAKDDGVVVHLSDFVLIRHFSFCHPVFLNIQLRGCIHHRDLITADLKCLPPVDLCGDRLQPAVPFPVPHPDKVKHAWMNPCHCRMDIFSGECLQGHEHCLVWVNLWHPDFPLQVTTLGMRVQSWVPFGLVTQKRVCCVQADPTVSP